MKEMFYISCIQALMATLNYKNHAEIFKNFIKNTCADYACRVDNLHGADLF